MDTPVIETVAEVGTDPALAAVLEGRAELMRASQANYEAVLTPREAGGLSHAERLALACRIAGLNSDAHLAGHYRQTLQQLGGGEAFALADPDAPPPADPRRAAMLRHVDLVTRAPRQATREDIVSLRAAGMAEADIVRLSQVIAFVNYQVRVIAGLRLLRREP